MFLRQSAEFDKAIVPRRHEFAVGTAVLPLVLRAARPTKRGIERADDRADSIIGNSIVNRPAVPASRQKALKPEARQLLRHRGLPPRQQRLQFANRFLAMQEIAQDQE